MTSDRPKVVRLLAVMVGMLTCLALINTADAATIDSDYLVQIEASSSQGDAVWEVTDMPAFENGKALWHLPEKVLLKVNDPLSANHGDTVASIDSIDLELVADPILSLNFSVSAGASPTTFTISSPLLSFPTIGNSRARASAAITVTDNGNDGAFYSGGYVAGTKSYEAHYNGLVPGGTLFANLVGNASTSIGFDSVTGQEDRLFGGGFVTGLGAISSMSTQYRFTVGPTDGASGTSTFVVLPVPEPSGLVLLLLGSVLLIRRRR